MKGRLRGRCVEEVGRSGEQWKGLCRTLGESGLRRNSARALTHSSIFPFLFL